MNEKEKEVLPLRIEPIILINSLVEELLEVLRECNRNDRKKYLMYITTMLYRKTAGVSIVEIEGILSLVAKFLYENFKQERAVDKLPVEDPERIDESFSYIT